MDTRSIALPKVPIILGVQRLALRYGFRKTEARLSIDVTVKQSTIAIAHSLLVTRLSRGGGINL